MHGQGWGEAVEVRLGRAARAQAEVHAPQLTEQNVSPGLIGTFRSNLPITFKNHFNPVKNMLKP